MSISLYRFKRDNSFRSRLMYRDVITQGKTKMVLCAVTFTIRISEINKTVKIIKLYAYSKAHFTFE